MSKWLAKLQDATNASKHELIAVTTLLGLTIAALALTHYRATLAERDTRAWLRALDSLAGQDQPYAESIISDRSEESATVAPHPLQKHSRYERKKPPPAPININTASPQQLMQLPGIAEEVAARIIEERARRPYASPDDLLRVKGIGKKKLEQLRPYVRTQ